MNPHGQVKGVLYKLHHLPVKNCSMQIFQHFILQVFTWLLFKETLKKHWIVLWSRYSDFQIHFSAQVSLQLKTWARQFICNCHRENIIYKNFSIKLECKEIRKDFKSFTNTELRRWWTSLSQIVVKTTILEWFVYLFIYVFILDCPIVKAKKCNRKNHNFCLCVSYKHHSILTHIWFYLSFSVHLYVKTH